ncbi:aldo/keto reductase [Nitratireductor basaltis]|uniref:NADP-dependent oxidoreductase n=1 Tax=Nitratireductor basaltis TaxID=472175 RepID=A0A084U5K9_9HYPH|nr:aldo/keto reductase [Nitratireductor basaltis]KFB08245.1 NADP-dependent oxidoreductase [Nitratireductor basaltis]
MMLPRNELAPKGPEVSRLCLGTMMFGDQADEAASAAILNRYLEAGGNFIDTADSYAGTRSESILGRLLAGRDQNVVLATKCGNPLPGVEGSGGLSPEWISRAAELSRERLQCEVIDLYYLHHDDNLTPLDEVMGAIGALLERGIIRFWGVSNFRPWKIVEMVRLADRAGIARPVAAQPYYHMLNRMAEADYLPACQHFGIGVVPYSPLARGVLTGKYRAGTPEGSRAARGDKRMLETEFHPATLELAARAADHADTKGRTPAHLALQWVLANSAVKSVLIGPRTLEQLEAYLGAVNAPYDADDEAFLSALCSPGTTPVPNYWDPRAPLYGRKVSFPGE